MMTIMELTKNGFETLKASLSLATLDARNGTGRVTQRQIAEASGLSLGTVNHAIRQLRSSGFLSALNRPTEKGKLALEPYRVRNAIIMAAGMSSRFAPLSYEKPKGLFVVKGEVLIERQIRQLMEAGISDICVVVGYMQEKFFYLSDKFGVEIVVNEDYYKYNNPSSLVRVLDKLSNTYICSSDDYFTQNVFERYVYDSYYATSFREGQCDEWGVVSDAKGRIIAIDHNPKDMFIMLGHAYFSKEFSSRFSEILRREYGSEKVRKELWEGVLESNLDELRMNERRYAPGIVNEFDSLDELRAFDPMYVNDSGTSIFRNICETLGVEEKDISGIVILKNGLTNLSFVFTAGDKGRFVYRHPGVGTEKWISRESEAFSERIAKELGLDSTIIRMDSVAGWKISEYVEDSRTLDYGNDDDVKQAIGLLKRLHGARVISEHDSSLIERTRKIEMAIESSRMQFEDYISLKADIWRLIELANREGADRILCHCDSYAPNFLIGKDGAMSLIDWEYSGNDDPAGDVGTFIACSEWPVSKAMWCIGLYLGDRATARLFARHMAYAAMASYYWFVWALHQESMGNLTGKWLHLWYDNAKKFMKEAFRQYEESDEKGR